MPPAEEYAQRLQERELRVAQYERRHITLGNIRLLIGVAAAFMGWFCFGQHIVSWRWLGAPVAAFVGLAIYHSRVLQARSRAERAAAVYRNGLARIEDRWAGLGQTGDRFNDPQHVYAADLDLFGKGGLFDLLSTARTRMGESALAKWLLAPSPIAQIQERHAAISELRDQLDFREDISVLGEDAGVGVHPDALLGWAEARNQMDQRWIRPLAVLLAVLAIAFACLWGDWGTRCLIITVVFEAGLTYRFHKQLDEILYRTEHAFKDLDLLFTLLVRIESHTFHAAPLQTLQKELSSQSLSSSLAIARLRTIVNLISSRRNLILRVLDVPLMYSMQLACAAEAWRRVHGPGVRSWLNALGEFEALISLSAYSYEHPADPFPEFATAKACFQAEELGHPLIAASQCVRNSVAICGETRVLLVSGSNMSGKSTLLRAVGINIVLAMAGAPVRARQLRLSALQVGASIRVNDSLQEGSSRFYAEILRLRKLFDLAQGDPPLLFLLDELLQGTNSNDRRIGAEGIIREFLNRDAIGLASTHDLALTDMGGQLNEYVHNVHFQDEFKNGRIKFDYKLREGVVTKSNGLELMRSIGLDV